MHYIAHALCLHISLIQNTKMNGKWCILGAWCNETLSWYISSHVAMSALLWSDHKVGTMQRKASLGLGWQTLEFNKRIYTASCTTGNFRFLCCPPSLWPRTLFLYRWTSIIVFCSQKQEKRAGLAPAGVKLHRGLIRKDGKGGWSAQGMGLYSGSEQLATV